MAQFIKSLLLIYLERAKLGRLFKNEVTVTKFRIYAATKSIICEACVFVFTLVMTCEITPFSSMI